MGYIVHLLDAPSVSDAAAAQQFVAEQRALPPAAHDKFAAFVQAISPTYPDLSEEDEDGDNDDNLWEEGLDELPSFGAVKQLVVKVDLTDAAVVDALVAAACLCGLKLYDDEGQVVYGV